MFRHSFFIYVYLLSGFNIFCFGVQIDEPLQSVTLSSKAIIAAQRRDKSDGFLIADFQVTEGQFNYTIVFRYVHLNGTIRKECNHNVRTEAPVVDVTSTSFTRSTEYNTAILVWSDKISDSHFNVSRPQIIGIFMGSCSSTDLGLTNLRAEPIVSSYSDSYNIYVDTPTHCRGESYCQFFYRELLSTDGPNSLFLHYNYVWPTLHIEYSYWSMDWSMTHGFDTSNTYRIAFTKPYGYPRTFEFKSLSNVDTRIKVISTNGAICYVADSSVDTTVNCMHYNSELVQDFCRVIKFDVPVTPIAVVSSVYSDNIYLLVGETSCKNEKNCWNLMWTRLKVKNDPRPSECKNVATETKDSLVSDSIHDISISGTQEFACTGEWKNMVITKTWPLGYNETRYGYACRNGNQFSYDTADILW